MSAYDIKGEEKTPRTSKMKEKARGGYVCIYECGKKILQSTYEHAWAEQDTTISMMKEIVDIYSSEIKDIRTTK